MKNNHAELLGKRFQFTPHFSSGKRVWGKVTYVHPRGRFALLESEYTNFLGQRVRVRECFKIANGKLV